MAFEPFSMVDYPGHIVATVFFGGCNFRCGYCHNPLLVNVKEKSLTSPSAIDMNDAPKADGKDTTNITGIIDFLKSRRGLLDGVCMTGGEPLLSWELPILAREVKELGFKVKLDTNGSNLQRLQEAAPYLDYIAMDIKAAPEKYDQLTGSKNSWEKASQTIEWIKQSGIVYEFRTTVLPVWHSFEDLKKIRNLLGEETTWILQQFRQPPEGVLDEKIYEAYPDSWLKGIGAKVSCQVRGLH